MNTYTERKMQDRKRALETLSEDYAAPAEVRALAAVDAAFLDDMIECELVAEKGKTMGKVDEILADQRFETVEDSMEEHCKTSEDFAQVVAELLDYYGMDSYCYFQLALGELLASEIREYYCETC